jgi:hypothetical protein
MRRLFRTTAWPGTLPPVTQIETLGPHLLDGEMLRLDLDAVAFRSVDIPDELYLRELGDLDLDDPSAILDFTNTYGRLGHTHPARRRELTPESAHDDEAASIVEGQIIRLLGVTVPNERTSDRIEWQDAVVSHPAVEQFGVSEKRIILDTGPQHLDTFRAWATAFRILTDIYGSYLGLQGDSSDVVNLTIVLTELLDPFSPTLQVRYESDLDTEFDPFENVFPRLENVLALQMYRHIAAEDSYLRCENEPCGRLFVHQRGRARSGQFRGSGVKYCSKNCAKAQAQRGLRRRARKNKTT